MTRVYNLTSSLGNLANRFHARMLGFSKPATGFLRQPEPRSIGSYQRGLQLKAGNIMFAGHLIEAPRTNLWDIA
ncbi:MAG: heparinase, partial [Paracoccaceae bacterium]